MAIDRWLTAVRMRLRSLVRAHTTLERFPSVQEALVHWLRILVAAGALLLVLACANVGNAMLARSTARSGELAMRLALGASRWGLARTLFFESLVLSLAAGALGLGAAALVAKLLEGAAVSAQLPPLERPGVDWFVIGSCVALCLVVAVGAGLSPMWSVRHASVSAALQRSGRSVSPGGRRLTQTLMTAQVAIALVLLVGAALFVRSIHAKIGIDVGLEKHRVQTFRLEPRRPRGEPSHALRLELVERLRALPGVRAATVAFLPPFYSGNEAQILIRADGAPEGATEERLMLNAVHRGFFAAIDLPFIGGRDFIDAEFNLPVDQSPLILGESVARRVFGTTDVVGSFVVTSTEARRQIVGVVRDSRQRQLTSDDTMDLAFQPFRVDYWTPFVTGILSVETPRLNIWPDVRQAIAAIDPSVVMFEAKSVDEGIRATFGHDILTMRITLAFGVVAIFLAGVGLASVLARGFAERQRELGIRTALGATPARLAALVGRQSVGVLVVSVTVGTLAMVWLTRYIESRLYGVSPLDPTSFVAAIAFVAVVMTAASLPTCRRAARVQPAVTLKEQ